MANPTYDHDPDFCAWYSLYPNKKAKPLAYRAWCKCENKPIVLEMLSILQNQIDNELMWKRGYIPYPATYLNQRRFEDGLSPTATSDTPFTRNITATKEYIQRLHCDVVEQAGSSVRETVGEQFRLGWG